MTPRARNRLISIIIVVVGLSVAASLALYGLSGKITYFKTPTDIAAGNLPDRAIRLGGMVKEGTLQQSGDSYSFVVTDFSSDINVAYRGILPDLFREGQGIVAEGVLTGSGRLSADSVLAKHDERYMPREVVEALKAQGVWNEGGGTTQ